MVGEQSNEEKMHLEEKIKQLNAELEEKQHKHQLLSQQQKRLLDDVRRVKRDLHKTNAAMEELTSKIEELNLLNDSSERQLKLQVKEKLVKKNKGDEGGSGSSRVFVYISSPKKHDERNMKGRE